MIDIHSHILPGLDDGASDLNDAIDIARQAADAGIRLMFATPHHANGHYDNPAGVILPAVEDLNRALTHLGVPLKVLPGQEIRVNNDLMKWWDQRELLTLGNSRYILLELPFESIPHYVEEICHELTVLKLVPIIAHPERNLPIVRQPEHLQKLLDIGALSQVTAQSVTGLFGKKIQRTACELCRAGMVHFVASDVHDVETRPNHLQQAYAYIASHFGSTYANYLQHNAECVVHNEPIEAHHDAAMQASRKGRLWSLFK